MRNGWVWGRAPATIANGGPGFDVFALAIHGPRDEVAIRPAVRDSLAVEGVGAAGLPTKFGENTAGIVIDALRAATGISHPLQVRVRKGVPPSRGLGSSAASCAGAALAFLKAFPSSSSLGAEGFIQAAVAAEPALSGRHSGNVARAATLALALSRGAASLAGRCLEDRLAEPTRASFLSGFAEAKAAALGAGATGFAISGSGSTVFGLAPNRVIAGAAANAMCGAFKALGTHAMPLVTTTDNFVPLGAVVAKAGPRFSVVAA